MFSNIPRLITLVTQAKNIVVGTLGCVVLLLFTVLLAVQGNARGAALCLAVAAGFALFALFGVWRVKSAGQQPQSHNQVHIFANGGLSIRTPLSTPQFGPIYQAPSDAAPTAGAPAAGSYAPEQPVAAAPTSFKELGMAMYEAYEAQHPSASTDPSLPYGVAPSTAPAAPASAGQWATATTVTSTAPATPVSPDLDVIGWIGPVKRQHVNHAMQLGGRDVDTNPENTLLFTRTQVIALMVRPGDLSTREAELLPPALVALTQVLPSNAAGQQDFEMRSQLTWGDLVAPLLADLPRTLGTHLNFAFPYAQIERVEIHDQMIDSRLVVHLSGDRPHTYTVYQGSLLAPLAQALGAYVQVS